MKSKQKLMAKISQLLQSSRMDLAASSEQFRKDIELITYCREYQALGEEFQAAMSLEVLLHDQIRGQRLEQGIFEKSIAEVEKT
jgi:hypothetical protein